MPKVKIYCDLKQTNLEEGTASEYDFEFCREVEVPTNDLTAFYYAVRNYFRKELSSEEKDLISKSMPENKETIKTMKRRKHVSLKELFACDYYVEGVDKIGTNKYKLMWGV